MKPLYFTLHAPEIQQVKLMVSERFVYLRLIVLLTECITRAFNNITKCIVSLIQFLLHLSMEIPPLLLPHNNSTTLKMVFTGKNQFEDILYNRCFSHTPHM